MSDRRPTDQDRLSDLAADYCTVGVSATERQEFEELASRPENQKKVERIELTAAAINLVYAFRHIESMPRGVHDRLLVAAGEFIGSGQLISKSQTSKVDLSPSRSTPDNRFSWREAVSLAVTAACLALLLSGYNPFARTVDQLAVDPPAVALTPTPVQRLDSLITAAQLIWWTSAGKISGKMSKTVLLVEESFGATQSKKVTWFSQDYRSTILT